MSGRKLNFSSHLLAALAVLALASGCRLFRPNATATTGTASPSDVRQASFDGEEGEQKKDLAL